MADFEIPILYMGHLGKIRGELSEEEICATCRGLVKPNCSTSC